MRAWLLLAGLLLSWPAFAQEVAPPAVTPHFTRRQWREAFDSANTTHDGRLTLAQAQAGMPGIARNFDAIDSRRNGYVTKDDIRAFYVARAHAAGAK